MKRISSFTILITGLLPFTSCQNTPDAENLETGIWHITDFKEKGNQHKKEYTAYVLRFNADSTVTASFNHHSYKGKWNMESDYSTDDEPVSNSHLTINLKGKPFREISGNYIIGYFSENTLILESENFTPMPSKFITLKKVE